MKGFEALPAPLQGNPFFHFGEETHFVPAWDKIKPAHVLPAFDYALKEAHFNLDKILNNKRKPTFKNTIEALEQADELAAYFASVLFNLVPKSNKQE